VSFSALSPVITVRNVYLLINYGDYVDGANTNASPYVQLLSTTNPASAHLDFVNVRLGGTDTTGGQVLTDEPTSSSNDIDNIHKSSNHARTATIVGVVAGTLFLVATGIIVYFMYRRRQKRRLAPATDVSTANMTSTFNDTAYRPLLLAAPPGEFHPVQGYHDEGGSTWTRDFHPEDLYAQFAPLHGEGHVTSLSRYEESDPR
jgi:hypothetical protein